MKKILIGIFALVTVLSFETTNVLASDPGTRRNYVDADNNGVYGYFRGICKHINTVRDNVCSHFRNDCTYADGSGICGNYVDTNNDGFCDNCTVSQGYGNGQAYRNSNIQAYGNENRRGYVSSGGHHGRGHHGGHHH